MNTTKRTRRKFSYQQKQDILNEADAVKAAGGEYKEVIDKYSLASATLSKWRNELKINPTASKNGNRKASKASKRKTATKTTSKATKAARMSYKEIVKELQRLDDRRTELLSIKIADTL